HSADAIQIIVCEGFHLVEVLRLAVHHPDFGVGNIHDLAASPVHEAGEDRALVRHQERRESDGKDEPEVFGAVAEQHLNCHEVHEDASAMNTQYDVNTVHQVAKKFADGNSSLADPFHENVHDPVDQAIVLDERERAGN